jgi:hypothetical protein
MEKYYKQKGKKGKYFEKPKPRGMGARESHGACWEYMTVRAGRVTVTPAARDITVAVTLTRDAPLSVDLREPQASLAEELSNCLRRIL